MNKIVVTVALFFAGLAISKLTPIPFWFTQWVSYIYAILADKDERAQHGVANGSAVRLQCALTAVIWLLTAVFLPPCPLRVFAFIALVFNVVIAMAPGKQLSIAIIERRVEHRQGSSKAAGS